MQRGDLIGLGIAALIAGGIGFGATTTNRSECESGLGHFARAVDPNVNRQCDLYTGGWDASVAVLGVGAISLFVGISRGARRPGGPKPGPPGWYQDPIDPRRIRWWNGSVWTDYFEPNPLLQGRDDTGPGRDPSGSP